MKSLGKYLSLCMLVLAAVTFAMPRHYFHNSIIEHAAHDDHASAHLDHTDCAACECSLSNGLQIDLDLPLVAPALHVDRIAAQSWPQITTFKLLASLRGPPSIA